MSPPTDLARVMTLSASSAYEASDLTRRRPGAGLGIAIAIAILELNSGSMALPRSDSGGLKVFGANAGNCCLGGLPRPSVTPSNSRSCGRRSMQSGWASPAVKALRPRVRRASGHAC